MSGGLGGPAEARPVMVVTGGARGIGASCARLAAARGWDVGVNWTRHGARAAALVAEIQAAGGQAFATRADVADDRAVRDLFAAADARPGPLRALVNNAGEVTEALVADCTAEALARTWAVNVTGAFLCAREAIRRMSVRRGAGGGVIVNVSSIAGRTGGAARRVHYSASKAALNTFTLGLAREVGEDGIRVCAVVPGPVDTEIHEGFGGPERLRAMTAGLPIPRPATTTEIAHAILWLASTEATYATGTLLELAGGR